MGCPKRRAVVFLWVLGAPCLACFQDDGPSGGGGASAGGGSSSTGSTGAPDACQSYAEKVVECEAPVGMSQDQLQALCEVTLAMFGETCRELYLEVLACYDQAKCAALAEGLACQAEASVFLALCDSSTNSTCESYGQKAMICGLEGQDAETCQAALDEADTVNEECRSAMKDLYACRAELVCGDLASGTGCEAKAQDVMSACA